MTSRYQKFCFNWLKKRINDISSRFSFEKCSSHNKITKSKKLKCSSWLSRVEFFDIMLKTLCFFVQILIDHVNFNTFFKNKELNKKKTRWWKKLNNLNLHIKYKLNKQNSANNSFRQFDYESNELIIVNAITNNVNKLIMNRVHVHAFNVKWNSLMNRNDESSSILFLMKKNRQFFLNSKTTNKMNIENDFIRDENFENIVSHAYVNLVVKTKILSTKKIYVCNINESFLCTIRFKIIRNQKTTRKIQENVSSRCRKNRKYCFEKSD